MRNQKIILLSFFTILFFASHSLSEVKHWNQIDTDDLTQVEIRDNYSALLKHDQAELNKTVKQCLEVINKDNDPAVSEFMSQNLVSITLHGM